MNNLTEGVVTIFSLIIGVAILAIIVSPKANTTGVIQAAASGFVNSLATAESPVTGANVNIQSGYPASNTSSSNPFSAMLGGFGTPNLSGAGNLNI